MFAAYMKELASAHYTLCRDRFSRDSDGRRLWHLGIILVMLGALPLIGPLSGGTIAFVPTNEAALFGGIAVILFILKTAKPRLCLDWFASGVLYLAVGFVLQSDSQLDDIRSLIFFCVFLCTSGLVRIWVGLTTSPRPATGGIAASGGVGLLSIFWILTACLLGMPTSPQLILSVDILLFGVSIAGLGFSLVYANNR